MRNSVVFGIVFLANIVLSAYVEREFSDKHMSHSIETVLSTRRERKIIKGLLLRSLVALLLPSLQTLVVTGKNIVCYNFLPIILI